MQPATVELQLASSQTAQAEPEALLAAYEQRLEVRGRGRELHLKEAARFLDRWPELSGWVDLPLRARLTHSSATRQFVTFLIVHRHLQPGWDWLLASKLAQFWRDITGSPMEADLQQFTATALQLGYQPIHTRRVGSQSIGRLLIQTGRPLTQLTTSDLKDFEQACSEHETRTGKSAQHYRNALKCAHNVLFHLGVVDVVPTNGKVPMPFPERFADTHPILRDSFVNYLERKSGTCRPKTVTGIATRLSHFGRFISNLDPMPTCMADLDRTRHIEPFLNSVAHATSIPTGKPITVADQARRIRAVSVFLSEINEWGWPDAPTRRLIFRTDIPRTTRPLPRYIPVDADRRLTQALTESANQMPADALLLARATGLRIGELRDLELDCVHQIEDHGSWLKVPLGKLDSERMIPIDPPTVEVIDRIVDHRSQGQPLPHPRTGKPVQFLLVRHGRRLSMNAIRHELSTCAETAGIDPVTPHQLRHTYATSLINAGVSLQALMALLGHVSAEMSLRYAHLFDATVRTEYERSLNHAKHRIGHLPVTTPSDTSTPQSSDPDHATIRTALGSGYCIRATSQGPCTYANICENCPSFHVDQLSIPALTQQQADTQHLLIEAQHQGHDDESQRHQRLLDRLETLLQQAAG